MPKLTKIKLAGETLKETCNSYFCVTSQISGASLAYTTFSRNNPKNSNHRHISVTGTEARGEGWVHKHFFDRDARLSTNFNYPKKYDESKFKLKKIEWPKIQTQENRMTQHPNPKNIGPIN